MLTKKEIKEVCDKHIEIIDEFVESKFSTENQKIGALQQQLAIMRLCDDLLRFSENITGQE